MKKLLANPFFDMVVKALITLLMGWLIYLMVDVRDFIKYKQPRTDEEQNTSITYLSNRIDECNATQNEKNENVNGRIDQQADKISRMERKLDIIIFKLTGTGPTAYN